LPCPPRDSKDKSRLSFVRGSQPRHRVKLSERKASRLGLRAPVSLDATPLTDRQSRKTSTQRIRDVIDQRDIEPPKPDEPDDLASAPIVAASAPRS